MRKLLLIALLTCNLMAKAQSPLLTVKGNDSTLVKMSQLLVNVKIIGNIAYTTAEMHFFNSGTKQMEAELLFPLPEGVSVSRYAIDINGKIREAVPVNKNKGKQVFEAIEHRRVDPGLLEKVEGNNFKTRIYPIMPKGERIVIIGYEEALQLSDKNNLSYQFLSKYQQVLEKFEVKINVLGAATKPTITNENNTNENISWTPTNQTSFTKTNYQPAEKWMIKIPVQQDVPSVVVQTVNDQYYFYINTSIENNKIQKKTPTSIGIIWDNSLSCKNKDVKKELALLDAYFASIKNTTVTLYLLNYTFSKDESFIVANGHWAALRAKLQNTIFDGGTRFSQINYAAHDECLFFTDGLSSLSSNNLSASKKPVYTISSSVSSDYAFLNYYAQQSGANFINLNQLDSAKALDKLLNQSLRFLGIKENNLVTEMYPTKGTPVAGSFSVAGISLKENNEIVLLFGYGEKVLIEKTITIDAIKNTTTDVSIEKLWAQKKITDLELQYTKNAEEIETIGKRYGIITQNTSLIVLENISDYIAYDIVPPAELRADYDRIVKEQRQARLAEKKDNWKNIDQYFNELFTWWKKDIHYLIPKSIPITKKNKSEEIIQPLASASIGTISTSATQANLAATPDDSRNRRELSEVVVVSTGVRRQSKSIGYSSSTVIANNINTNVEVGLQGKVAGLQVTSGEVGASSSVIVRGNSSISNTNKPLVIVNGRIFNGDMSQIKQEDILTSDVLKDAAATSLYGSDAANGAIVITTKNGVDNDSTKVAIKTTSWNPDRLYLKAIKAAAAEKKYAVYLELRETQINNPNFYYDVANYFYDNGNREKALLILSNIADLGLENHQLYKTLTYTLRQWQAYDDALFTAKQIVKWREHEPQSHRDLALTLENNKQYQAAFDELIKALEVNYYGEMSGQYEGVEDIILMDINRMMAEHSSIKTGKLDKKYLAKMPIDVRIILNWNQMDVDIDLHIIEPTKEECYYGHTSTEAGAKFSKDFTQGYGPEQYLIRNAIKGKYAIKTNYFGESTLTENGPATVMVEIYITKNGIAEKKIKTIQLGQIKENQVLAEIMID
jgi:TonB-dependent SusC/RagA subfamily outer membrane receptor